MREDSLINIIIPVYNAENYLRRCIESVLCQTYRNIEVILVDDGSKDSSPNICDEYTKKDKRIKVIHKDNAGPGSARRDGVKMAMGEYISFIDADDYIDKNMFQVLIKKVKRDIDIAQFGYRKVTTTGEVLSTVELKPIEISGSYECALYYASQNNTTNFLWNKLYRAKLFQNVVFPQLYAGEDSCILTQLYAFAKRIISIDKPLYNYVMTTDSLCRRPFEEKKLDNIKAGKFMYYFYQRYFPELSNFSALHICSYAAKSYCELNQVDIDISEKENISKSLVDDFNQYYSLSKGSIARRKSSKLRIVFVELFKFNRKICSFVYNTFNKYKKFKIGIK